MKFSCQDLDCRRGDAPVLSGVRFDIASGTALIVRGPNGSGKTTLLRTIAGLTPEPRGKMNFTTDEVAYAGHADGVKLQLSVVENLSFWAAIYGTTSPDTALRQFDLDALRDRPAGYLSAGQRRRLSLARLVMTNRGLWALDEPTVSLDAENVARFAQVVAQHLESGGAAIIATHIDLGLPTAQTLDITSFRATTDVSDDPFLDAFSETGTS